MPNNKIVLNGEVLIDLTEDTVTEADVAKGKTFHRADGLKTEGTLEPSSGGGGVSAKDVNFYDYDGTLLHSYSVKEAQELTELPELPSHDGLVCQGWNYSLDDIKAYGYGVNVGAMYVTDDGKTRLYISIESDGRMTVPICFGQTVANGVTVDWGDGSTETFDGTGTVYPTHEYSALGDYVITLAPQDGCTLTLGGGAATSRLMGGNGGTVLQVYASMLKKAEIGNNAAFSAYAFYACFSLTSVTIPASVTAISVYAFEYCYSLTSLTIPSSVTAISNYLCAYCYSLTSVALPALLTAIGSYAFAYCRGLTSVTIPAKSGSLLLSIGREAFNYCYSLTSVTLPASVYSLEEYAFGNCINLQSITVVRRIVKLYDYSFGYCSSLRSISLLENGEFSMRGYCFKNCTSLTSFSFRSYGLSGDYFSGCKSIAYLDFTECTSVMPLSSSNYLTNINSDCKILVPAALYDEWIVATNWSAVADRIVAV